MGGGPRPRLAVIDLGGTMVASIGDIRENLDEGREAGVGGTSRC